MEVGAREYGKENRNACLTRQVLDATEESRNMAPGQNGLGISLKVLFLPLSLEHSPYLQPLVCLEISNSSLKDLHNMTVLEMPASISLALVSVSQNFYHLHYKGLFFFLSPSPDGDHLKSDDLTHLYTPSGWHSV